MFDRFYIYKIIKEVRNASENVGALIFYTKADLHALKARGNEYFYFVYLLKQL